jgi:outer membrane biosynthesis protein TonB
MRSRRIDPFDKRAMALSTGLHVAIFLLAWLSTLYSPPEVPFITYEIELVSPPPAAQAEEVVEAAEELVVERPDPEPPAPEPEPEEVEAVEEPEPEPEPPPEAREEPVEQPPEPDEEVAVAAAPEEAPDEPPEESGEGINVRIEGLRRDYPAYYDNIIRQIRRCFRWREGGNWETTIGFVITRDGTATDLDFVSRSGNVAFDFEAYGAVECAGNGRFGPLPEELPWDRQPIRFLFQPSGAPLMFLPSAGSHTEVINE